MDRASTGGSSMGGSLVGSLRRLLSGLPRPSLLLPALSLGLLSILLAHGPRAAQSAARTPQVAGTKSGAPAVPGGPSVPAGKEDPPREPKTPAPVERSAGSLVPQEALSSLSLRQRELVEVLPDAAPPLEDDPAPDPWSSLQVTAHRLPAWAAAADRPPARAPPALHA
jgi:hypothetical protein